MDNNSEQLVFDRNRRDFLKKAGLALGSVFMALPVISAIEGCGSSGRALKAGNKAPQIAIDVSSLTSNGAALVTTDVGPDGAPILVHRLSPTQYEAHSMVCTHKGCVIADPDQSGIATCPCHGAQFDSGGRVLAGQAKSDLLEYPTSFNSQNKALTIKFKLQS
jgi:Rieske Fe-S protein